MWVNILKTKYLVTAVHVVTCGQYCHMLLGLVWMGL